MTKSQSYGKTGIPPSISIKYPTNRDVTLKNGFVFLDGKRVDDNAEGLWRIHNDLYDLTDFIERHPGGKDWLALTKGTDITEAFECHHISLKPEQLLPKYFVRTAAYPRNYKFNYDENGFFKTLKRRVREKMETLDRSKENKSKIIQNWLLVVLFTLAALTAKFNSYSIAFLTGTILTWTCISAHNFYHKKDNWRMRLYNLSLMSYREWRVSHILSHHLYTNTLHDLEISYSEPYLKFTPSDKIKGKWTKYLAWPITFVVYGFMYFNELYKRIFLGVFTKYRTIYWDDILIPLTIPVTMLFFADFDFGRVFKLWLAVLYVGGFMYCFISVNASHHHPEVLHEGDAHNPYMDWGLFQLDTCMDRSDIKGNLLLTLTHYGDHSLHHIFPTIDHALLPDLQGVLLQTCKDFEAECRETRWWPLIVGGFEQLVRTEPNPVPVMLRNKRE